MYDKHGNYLDPKVGNVVFKKKFVKLDMEQSSVILTLIFMAFKNVQECTNSKHKFIKDTII